MITPEDLAVLLAEGRYDRSGEVACRASVELHLAARLPPGCGLAAGGPILPELDAPQLLVDGRFVVEVWAGWGADRERRLTRRMMALADLTCVEALFLLTDFPMRQASSPHWRLIGPGKMFFWQPLPALGPGLGGGGA